LKIERNTCKINTENSARNYKEFDVDKFVKLVENKLEYNRDMDISRRATKLIDDMVDALDVVAPKKQFRIPRAWEGEGWFSDKVRQVAIRRDEAHRKALYEEN